MFGEVFNPKNLTSVCFVKEFSVDNGLRSKLLRVFVCLFTYVKYCILLVCNTSLSTSSNSQLQMSLSVI